MTQLALAVLASFALAQQAPPEALETRPAVDLHLEAPKKDGRRIRAKDYLFPASAMFVSGALDGTTEALQHHYHNGFKRRFPNANDLYWDPSVSWKNKYKNGDYTQGPKFPASTTALAWTTDAYHLLRTSNRAVQTVTLAWYIGDNKGKGFDWKKFALDCVVLTASRNLGFHATYSGLFGTK